MPGRPFRALIALDAGSPAVDRDLGALLRARGFDVREVAAADDAWRVACRDTLDVILAQLASIESRNLDLLRRARRALAPAPALLAIASSHELERAARLAGAHVTLRSTIARELVVDTAQRLARPIVRLAL